jgi:hypothetical protein
LVQMNFNAAQFDPSTGGADVFETGEYTFMIVQSEVKPTKAGNGTMLVFTLSCQDQGQAGKRLQVRLNVQNPSPQAVEIAFRELSAISHVCGILQWADTQQLHGRPFRARVEKVPRSDDPSKFGNEVRGYLDVHGNPPGQHGGGSGAPTPPQPTAPAPAPSSMPAGPAYGSPPQPMASAPATVQVPGVAPAAAPMPAAAPAPAPAPAPTPQPSSAPAATPPWAQAQPQSSPVVPGSPEAAQNAVPPWAQPS